MPVYLSLLRGINVSGQKKIKMDQLRSVYKILHFDEVETYIQSGNVVFYSKETDISLLKNNIEKKIENTFNFKVKTFIRTPEDFKRIIKNNPFAEEALQDETKLCVTFLSEIPDKSLLLKLEDYDKKGNQFVVSDREIWLYCPDGYGRSKINNNYFENKLKIHATTRNWRSVNRLNEMASEPSIHGNK